MASYSELPLQPRTPRALSDRGRYPEEVGQDDPHDDPLSDDDDDVEGLFSFDIQSESTNTKPCTPAQSVNGDDLSMSITESPMGIAMDVDPVSFPCLICYLLSGLTPSSLWYLPL